MVNPLITGQKKNQADVNKVLEELKTIQGIHESSMKVITDTQAQLEILPGVQDRLKEAEITIDANQRAQKLMNESLVDRCERNVVRITEVSREYQRLEAEMNSRDYRIKNNTEMVMDFKEKLATEMTTFMRQVTRDLDNFTLKTNKASQDLVMMNSFFQATQIAVNGFQQELTKVAYSASRVDEIFTNFMNQEYLFMKETL